MDENKNFTLTNRQNGNLAFKLFSFTDSSHFDHLQHNSFYSLIWVKNGGGLLRVNFSEYTFKKNTLFSFTPYQPFMFSCNEKIEGVAIQYHSDFYCIHLNPKETNCDTVIFNNAYQEPFSVVDKESEDKLNQILEQLQLEIQNTDTHDYKLLVPYLKIFLVTASRIKTDNNISEAKFIDAPTSIVLRNLKNAIENNFQEKHTAGKYAEMLNISPNSLAKLVKAYFNKTLTDLITERIIIQAKSELYLTNNQVKEIAWKLGYPDEFYFSRTFKRCTGISPKTYRDTVGFGKAEQN